jgi:RNA polymerase sigma factor (TIGR02999 family)
MPSDALQGERELEDLLQTLPAEAVTSWDATQGRSLSEILPEIYGELRALAAKYLQRERAGHTLQPTALVHEAYLRLVDQRKVDWKSRNHFLAIAARIMRRVLLQHAEARGAAKRGGGTTPVELDLVLDLFDRHQVSTVALHNTLRELEALDPRQGQIVELRFFGGLSIEETAEVMGISPATVKREWTIARMWLEREMAGS